MNISEYCTTIPIKIERNSSKEVESFWKIIFYKLGQLDLVKNHSKEYFNNTFRQNQVVHTLCHRNHFTRGQFRAPYSDLLFKCWYIVISEKHFL